MTRKEAIELLKDVIGFVEDNQGRDYDTAFRMAIEALSERTGEWLEVEVFHEVYDIEGVNTWGSEMQCDQCGFRHTAIEGHMAQYNFCPNCGADMRGIQMKKPITFNYKKYEDLRNAYKELLEDNNKLMADNKLLREKVTNLQIKIRILEGNNEKS